MEMIKPILATSNLSVQWTPQGGTNYECIDEYPTPNDSDYVTDNTLSASRTDVYGCTPSIPKGAKILKVVLRIRAYEGATTNRDIYGVLRVGGTDYLSAAWQPASSYTDYDKEWTTNPKTSAPWTWEDLNGIGANALQGFGCRAAADSVAPTAVYMSQCYVKIHYELPPRVFMV